MTQPLLVEAVVHGQGAEQRRAIAKAITQLESTRADHRLQGDEPVPAGIGSFCFVADELISPILRFVVADALPH